MSRFAIKNIPEGDTLTVHFPLSTVNSIFLHRLCELWKNNLWKNGEKDGGKIGCG